jgi:phage baseplate assembly protein V
VEALGRRLASFLVRGVVRDALDSGQLQRLDLDLLAEESATVPRYQSYGLTAVPLPGAVAVVLCANGVRDGAMVLAVEDQRYRLTGLADGEVALYDDQGQAVILARNGIRVVGQNIKFETEGVFRVDADRIELRAAAYSQTEVNGYGNRLTHTGGTAYSLENYTDGATVTPSTLSIDQPDLPTDHPDG